MITQVIGLAESMAGAAQSMANFHAALLGPGYFHAQELVHGEWQSFAGGPAWLAVDAVAHYNGDRPTRIEPSS